MQVKQSTCLEILQSMLTPLETLLIRGSLTEQLAALELAKKEVSLRLPIEVQSQSQQQALDILNLKACLELFCKRRIEKVNGSSLPLARKTELMQAITTSFEQACEKLQAEWPSIEVREEALLPLLLLRQSLENEIDFLIHSLKKNAQTKREDFKSVA